MMEFVLRGRTSNLFRLFLPDSTSSVGAGKTGLTSSSTNLSIAVIRELSAAATAYTGSNLEGITTLGTFAAPTSGKARFKEVDATNLPGVYEIQLANAIFDASDASRHLVGMVKADGVVQTPFRVLFEAVDRQNAHRFGMTALPATKQAGEAEGGLPILDNLAQVNTNTTSLSGNTTAASKLKDLCAAGAVDTYDILGAVRLLLASAAGEVAIDDPLAVNPVVTIRSADDVKTRITYTVDQSGRRLSGTLDAA